MANTKFSGDTGYRGVVKLGKTHNTSNSTDLVILLATSGQFNQNHNPIFSSGDWGAGYMNISEQVAYANNIIRVEGSMGMEVTAGDGFTAMRNFALINRGSDKGTYIVIFPNGLHGFQGFGWCTSLSFSMSQDAILTADMNWSSYIDGSNNTITTGESDNSAYGSAGSDGLPFDYNGLFPYWGSSVTAIAGSNSRVDDVMSWSAEYSSSLEMLKCCGTTNAQGDALLSTQDPNADGKNSQAPVAPDYLGLGPMSATCSLEIFKLGQDFDFNKFHHAKGFEFSVKSPAENTEHKILLPKVICNSNSSQIQTGTGWVTASFQYQAIGDGKGAPMDIDRDGTGGDGGSSDPATGNGE